MTCEMDNISYTNPMEYILRFGAAGLSKAIEVLYNEAMQVERTRYLHAEPYERTSDRNGYANGFKAKKLKTRCGILDLQVPQVRGGEFYPSFLEKGARSERALNASLAEMYVQGVSTRKVKKILEGLCGIEVTSSEVSRANKKLDESINLWLTRSLGKFKYLFFDARYEKVRREGSVVDAAVLIASGINEEGNREVLGVSVALSEHEAHWRNFFESLQKRGLHGVELITSDAHAGLKAALQAVFTSIPWQRCQFHMQQNAQAYVPKKSMKAPVAEDIRAIFTAPNKKEADRLLKMMVKKYESSAPKLSEWMEESLPEGFTVFDFPAAHRKCIRTSNALERLNKEVKRRTRVVGIFPNEASCLRLASAIVMEISEEWITGRTYLPRIESS